MWPPSDPVGKLAASTKLAELRSPDRRPSSSLCFYEGKGRDIFAVLEIKDDNGRRLGAITIVTRGDETGKLVAHGVTAWTDDEIRGNYYGVSQNERPEAEGGEGRTEAGPVRPAR